LGFIIDISTLNDAVSRKLTIASLQPMFFVNEKSANKLESIVKLLKIFTLGFVIDIVTLNDAIKLQYPEN
jgi:hypothetical protein